MPLYEYECRSCGTVIDVRHGFDEINAEPCPTCAGPLTRRFSPTGNVFKGSGFYVTDSRKSAGSGESTPA
ncbi:MAG: FmdB family zinc ribbon protein, partial [Vulcanimicrobiaceae bacterium]